MKVTINHYQPEEDLVEVTVDYHQVINDRGHSARLYVWVPNVDSREELRRLASEEARKFLQLMLSAHSASDPQQ